ALELSQFMSPNSNHAAPEGRRRQRSPESLIWVRRALRPLLCPCCEPFVVARDPEHRFPRLRVLYLLREGARLVCAIAPVFRVIDESLRHDRTAWSITSPARASSSNGRSAAAPRRAGGAGRARHGGPAR